MSEVALAAHHVARRFGPEQALDGVDLAVRRGEVVALVGLNGAGKSTLLRVLLGMVRPDAGHAEVLGRPTTDADRATWGRVGHLVEHPPRYDELTVGELLHATARLQGCSSRRARDLAAEVLHQLELSHWRGRPIGTLSLGNRQRLGVAAALVHRPEVIVLDEPTNALDPLGVVRVRELLRSAAVEQRAAVLVSSHHLDEVARMADRVVVLHRGRVVGELEPSGQDVERTFFARVLEAEQSAAGQT